MKLAFVGSSHWHLPLYMEPALDVPGATIVGMADPDPAVAKKHAEQFNCYGSSDFRDMIEKTKPDFVFALGRHADMPDETKYLIEKKIPCAVEKPCGITTAEVTELAKLAKNAGAFAAVPLVFRNGDFYTLLKDLKGDAGYQYMNYRFIAGFASRYILAGCDWMLDPKLSGGGCCINLSPHFFDLALLLLGSDVKVTQSMMANNAWGHPIEDYSAVLLESKGRMCLTETGYLYPAPTSTFDMHFAVRSPEHYIVAHDHQTVEIIDKSGKREMRNIQTTNVPNYRRFVFDVLERAKTGKQPLADLDDMVPIMKIVEDAYALGRPMKVI